jgi:stress response protein YsnF
MAAERSTDADDNDRIAMTDACASAVVGVSEANAEPATLIVPVIEESVVVRKTTVDRGGYRVVKKIHVREEEVDEPLLSHSVHIERRAVGRLLPSMEIPVPRQEGDTLIVSVVEEVLVTEKRLMLKEELHITQTDSTIRKPLRISLRSEEVSVEPLDPEGSPDHTVS